MPRAVVTRLTARPAALVLAVVTVIALAVGGWALLRPDPEPRPGAARPTPESAPTGEEAGGDEGGEYGLRFRPTAPGTVTALSFRRGSDDATDRTVRLWSSDGELLAEAVLPGRREAGWQSSTLTTPVPVEGSELYVASVSLDDPPGEAPPTVDGTEAALEGAGFRSVSGAHGPVGSFPAAELETPTAPVRPVLRATSASPAPTGVGPSPSGPVASPSDADPRKGTPSPGRPTAPGAFPGPDDTGVPAGVELSAYRGPMTIRRDGTTLHARRIEGTLTVAARNVVVERSSVRGSVVVLETGSLTISDSTVDAGRHSGSALGQYNLTMRRVEVRGAAASVSCNGNCDVRDSWLHDQYIEPGSDWHGDGFISNGGDNMVLRHNTLACDSEETGAGGACSAALAAYGDFAPITNLTVDNNLFVSSPAGYCLYGGYETQKPHGPQARNVVITDNVFERGSSGKCAVFGPMANIAPRGNPNGNVFSGNRWDDGKPLRAE